jgi:curli biogenesis system outer membrane secretion channel CsgG
MTHLPRNLQFLLKSKVTSASVCCLLSLLFCLLAIKPSASKSESLLDVIIKTIMKGPIRDKAGGATPFQGDMNTIATLSTREKNWVVCTVQPIFLYVRPEGKDPDVLEIFEDGNSQPLQKFNVKGESYKKIILQDKLKDGRLYSIRVKKGSTYITEAEIKIKLLASAKRASIEENISKSIAQDKTLSRREARTIALREHGHNGFSHLDAWQEALQIAESNDDLKRIDESRQVLIFQQIPYRDIAQTSTPKRIAVLDFDFSDVETSGDLFVHGSSDQNLSRLISNNIVNRLAGRNAYTVVEQSKIEKIIETIKISEGKPPSLNDPSTAVKIGRLLGVDAVVTGRVTQFSAKTENCPPFTLCRNSTKDIATVEVIARLIEVETGKVIVSSTGIGEEKQRSNFSVGISGMGSSKSKRLLLQAATNMAISDVVDKLDFSSSLVMPYRLPAEFTIADISPSGEITFEQGSAVGVQKGMILSLRRIARTINGSNGKPIRYITENIGEAEIISVDQGYSVGRIIKGNAASLSDSHTRDKENVKITGIRTIMGEYSGEYIGTIYTDFNF